jgi:hypothetical protein
VRWAISASSTPAAKRSGRLEKFRAAFMGQMVPLQLRQPHFRGRMVELDGKPASSATRSTVGESKVLTK